MILYKFGEIYVNFNDKEYIKNVLKNVLLALFLNSFIGKFQLIISINMQCVDLIVNNDRSFIDNARGISLPRLIS